MFSNFLFLCKNTKNDENLSSYHKYFVKSGNNFVKIEKMQP